MRRGFIAISLFTTVQLAQAQGSVTLYGVVDTGVEYYNNAAGGGSFVGMPTLTGEVPSRWGLRGVEELGNGYKVIFVLENGFAPSNGTLNNGGRLFGRQANVSLSGGLGAVTLGRQMSMTMYSLTSADIIGPSIHGIGAFDTYLPNSRSDNAVGYLGSFGGFRLGATYSFGRDAAGPAGPGATNCPGQVAGNPVACRQYTMLLGYDSTYFGAAAAYDVMRGGNGATAPLSSPGYTDTHVVVDGYFQYGSGKIGAGWIRRNTAASAHAQSDIWFVGMNYYVTPAFVIDGEALRYVLRSHSNSTMMIGRLSYFLSKRTSVYSSIAYMINSQFGSAPVAAGGTVAMGKNQLGVMMGVQQRF
ncbi:Outer membrane protein (porin) [Paraburkholderia steynii]|uniref:Outer membrane protein (Porin) n=1 Tax=Paraburkholderia steynii TaxID=1245441 RepID=A0A7Z7FJF9_9BURK|nr:porin [Paraburkholderia steynii]SDI57051.1 Outer membrane protein (porin) [Paraburkholderia steynii]